MGDNGSLENAKPIDEILEKQRLFEQNPDDFVHVSELIIAVRKNKNGGIDTLINTNNRADLEVSLMRLTHQCFGVFNAMSYEAMQANKKIIQPKGSIMNFVRGGKKRG